MILQKETAKNLASLLDGHFDTGSLDMNSTIGMQLHDLFKALSATTNRRAIEWRHKEIVPETIDIMANTMMDYILSQLEAEECSIDAENALWDYLKKMYCFDLDQHNLEKHTTEEAFSYAFRKIGIHND